MLWVVGYDGLVAKQIRRLATDEKIVGAIPTGVKYTPYPESRYGVLVFSVGYPTNYPDYFCQKCHLRLWYKQSTGDLICAEPDCSLWAVIVEPRQGRLFT